MLNSLMTIAMPLLLASLAGLISEQAGELNISLEGMILLAAFSSIFGYNLTHSLFIALTMGMGSSLFLTFLYVLFRGPMGCDPFVTGLGLNLLTPSLISILSVALFGTQGTVRADSSHLISANVTLLVGMGLYLAMVYLETYSPFGLLVRTTGKCPGRVREKGYRPETVIRKAHFLGGIYAGVAGSFLSLSIGAFVPNMSAGKGWLALVALYGANKNVMALLPVVLVFSLFESLSHSLQGYIGLPHEIWNLFPYLLSLLIIVVINGRDDLISKKKGIKKTSPLLK